jgi:two-component system, sensor histidine kinase and response regulator
VKRRAERLGETTVAGLAVKREPEAPAKVKILIVDDRPANLLTLESVLQDLGQELVRATSGREALRHLLRDDFAVILLDVKMPDMDGFETATLIRERERSRHTPILFLTAHKEEEHLFRGYYAGAVDFLYKPINPDVLRSKVSVFVDLSLKSELLRRQAEVLKARNQELELLIEERRQAEERIVALNTDLERRVRERTAELSRSNEELRQFAYAASHDLKEPMRTIASYTQLLTQRYNKALDDDAREFLGYVVEGVRRMDALLSDLLAYSQHLGSRPAGFQQVNAEAVLMGVLMNLQASINESCAIVTHDPLPVDIASDFAQLSQVFQNLISNSLKYRGSETPRIHISAAEGEEEWQFSVRDNGVGIEPAYSEQVFGVFKRLHGREYPGTGMGLAICKKIIERHGGRIWVESEPGKGANFSFTIPK